MAEKLNGNRLGITLGILFGALHMVWAILVAVGIASEYLEWILPLHFISLVVPLAAFSIVNAVILIAAAFIGGYITGWLFAFVWNWVGKR